LDFQRQIEVLLEESEQA
jgi:chromosome segregation ATPase